MIDSWVCLFYAYGGRVMQTQKKGNKKLAYQYSRKNLEEIRDWLLKKVLESGRQTEEKYRFNLQALESRRSSLSLIWFQFSNAWTEWCRVVRDRAQQDPGKLRNIPLPLIGRSGDEEYRKDFPYYEESSKSFGPTIATQKRFFEFALRNEGFPLLDPFVLKPYLETLIIYYAFVAPEMPSSLTTGIDNAFIQIAWQAGYYTRAISEELGKWERTDASNVAKQSEAEKRRKAIKVFVLGNPRLAQMSKRSLAEYIHKNFPWGPVKAVTVPQLRKDLAKAL